MSTLNLIKNFKLKSSVIAGVILASVSMGFSTSALAVDDTMQMGQYQNRLKVAVNTYQNHQFDKAFERLMPFAKTGEKMAQYLVAVMYLTGKGTEVNVEEGYAWLSVAIEQKERQWIRIYDNLNSQLDDTFRQATATKVESYINDYGIANQKLKCRVTSPTGSNLKKHVCEKMQIRRGLYYVEEGIFSI